MKKDHDADMSNYRRFLSGAYCNRLDTEVLEMIAKTKRELAAFNDVRLDDAERRAILAGMLGSIGRYSSVGRNFTCQCGKHIFIGEKSVINDNCTMMDENYIHIGNQVLVAPNVQFYTASHPIDFEDRFVEKWDEISGELFFRTRALPITVEDRVWIGGGSIILAGVTIGEGCVIGAGSVVTRSIPRNSLAVGNPCRVIKILKPRYRLRVLSEKDIPALQVLFRMTVLYVNSRDYTREEVEDWASCADSEVHMKELLSQNHYVAALDERGEILGFSSMNTEGYLHSMFVHKDYQRRGVGSFLLSAVEKKAAEYGVAEITTEVSLTARPFFERKGYEVVKVQKCKANRLHLTNFVMRKVVENI